jgi:hypothetical protein
VSQFQIEIEWTNAGHKIKIDGVLLKARPTNLDDAKTLALKALRVWAEQALKELNERD